MTVTWSAQTIEFIDELIESENVFALHTLGSPNTLAVYDQINDECIPQVMVATGHPAWGDPVNHPWTTGMQMSYSTEAILWGNWIRQNLADELPVKVAGLVMDNDFGLAYELGLRGIRPRQPRCGVGVRPGASRPGGADADQRGHHDRRSKP